MATKYFVLTNPAIGRSYNWNDTNNWSLSSGGTGGAGRPTASDDVIIDAGSADTGMPTNNVVVLAGIVGGTTPYPVCRNLTVDTGFTFQITWSNFTPLLVYGELNLRGTIGNEITLFNTVSADGGSKLFNLIVFGACGDIDHVIADKIYSQGGKRIIYDPDTCTVTNCPYWIDHAPETVHITDAAGLQDMRDSAHDNYILDNDIDLTAVTWNPIGTFLNPFTGTFDGGNNTISGLSDITHADLRPNLGLFGYTGSAHVIGALRDFQAYERAEISNLVLRDFDIEGGIFGGYIATIAALIGYNHSVIVQNVYVIDASFDTPVHVGWSQNSAAGGLIGGCIGNGTLQSQIIDCRAENPTLNNSIGGTFETGGMFGYGYVNNALEDLTISGCSVIGFSANNSSGIDGGGGFAGGLGGHISQCYAEGSMADANGSCGGFLGYTGGDSQYCHIENCYAKVDIDAIEFADSIAGFIGSVGSAKITNCYSTGRVTVDGEGTQIGGFVGGIYNYDASDLLNNCYSVGTVTADGDPADNGIGGFVGYLGNNIDLDNCAWLTSSNPLAIGFSDEFNVSIATLASKTWGTDEDDNTAFYSTDHPVYAQV